MLKWLLLLVLPFSLYALEITFQAGKEDFDKYTVLHVRDKTPFICEPQLDHAGEMIKVICAFSEIPNESFKPLRDDFFSVESETKKGTFFLIITPTHKLQLLPDVFDLAKDDTVFKSNVKLARVWLMVGFKEKFSLLKNDKTPDVGLNIPVTFTDNELLHVGSLDIEGNPVHIKQARDVTTYLKIKKEYEKGDYNDALTLINDISESFPDSIFMSELLYYKLKVLSHLENNDEVIALSKTYLRKYSSDENVPEILSLTARAYSKLGMNSDADYFYDRLFSEHEDSVYAKKGMIYKADQLLDSGSSKKALEFYERALNETKDIATAATAAERIAKYYLTKEKPKKAGEYVSKILQADPNFFLKNTEESLNLADALAEKGINLEASQIDQIVLKTMKKFDDKYEGLLKDSGLRLAQTDDKADAIKLLNRYLKEFPYGMYDKQVTTAKDSLFFENNDENVTAKLSKYDELMQTYKNDSIANKALYMKAQLLLDNGKYQEVLDIKSQLDKLDPTVYKDTSKISTQAAGELMKERLKEGKCNDVVNISSKYDIELSDKFDEPLFGCYMKVSQFDKAKKIAQMHIESKELTQKMKWLFKYSQAEFEIGEYKNAAASGEDLITLIGKEKSTPYNDIYRIMFDTYERLGNDNKMIEMMNKILQVYGDDFKDIERYVQMVTLGIKQKDDNIIITYAQKVMSLQEKTKTYTQSPYIEFTLYQAYLNQDNITRALDILYTLDARTLTKEQRSRQKYLLGSLLQKQ